MNSTDTVTISKEHISQQIDAIMHQLGYVEDQGYTLKFDPPLSDLKVEVRKEVLN